MAEGLNKAILLGCIGSEPELKITSGGPLLKIRMATTEHYLDREKNRQEKTEWHNVTLWGKRGEALAKILSKGMTILVEGSIHTRCHDKDGMKRYFTEITANNIIICGRGKTDGQTTRVERHDTVAAVPSQSLTGFTPEDYAIDDDIPF